ncbi:MAG: EamA family transporter [Gammaproteobacteria bacterium]
MSLLPSYVWLTLAASLLHAFSFAYSKQFLVHSHNRVKLAFYSQYSVGLFGMLLLPFVGVGNFVDNLGLIITMAVFVMVGQVTYLNALRHGDTSFVVPMLGLKMFFVAGISALLLNETYGPLVYLGAIGVFVSLFFLNDGKLRGSLRALLWVLITCLMFGAADVTVMALLQNGIQGFQIAAYIFAIPTLIMMPLSPVIFKNDWQVSGPLAKTLAIYGVVHLGGITLLMLAFMQSQQVTLINILQSSRGLLSIGVIYLMARIGFSEIETLTRRQLMIRSFGGLLMFASLTVAVLAH